MRTAAALIVAASVLVGCGGDDDGTAAAPVVVTSDDGHATLELPPGVPAGDITVEAVEVDGAAAAYELLPEGTTFDTPATLTITDVPAPERGALPVVISVSEDGDLEIIDETLTAYDEAGATATVESAIEHFSTHQIFYGAEASNRWLLTAGVAVPAEVTVGVPYEINVRAARLGSHFVVPTPTGDIVVDVGRLTISAAFDVRNGDPDEVRDRPARSQLTDYRGQATITCRERGLVTVTWFARFTVDETVTRQNGTTQERISHPNLRIRESSSCRLPATSTTTGSTSTTTAIALPMPIVSEIRIDLAVPVSTYSATAAIAGGDSELFYSWRMIGEECGTPKTPWTQRGETVTWSHSDQPPDSCTHASRDHAVTVSVRVSSDYGTSTVCTFEGSESRVITNPDCT